MSGAYLSFSPAPTTRTGVHVRAGNLSTHRARTALIKHLKDSMKKQSVDVQSVDASGLDNQDPKLACSSTSAISEGHEEGSVVLVEREIKHAMKIENTFEPAVSGLENFDQESEIARLAEFASQISICGELSSLSESEVARLAIAVGIKAFIDMDLLRYGALSGLTGEHAFGVVRQSDIGWIQQAILPLDYTAACLLTLIARGCSVVKIDQHDGRDDFMFMSPKDRTSGIEAALNEL
jgi:hypothetical protein